MTIERGTTQEVTITIIGWNLTGCDVYVTFKQGARKVTRKTMDSVTYANNATKIRLNCNEFYRHCLMAKRYQADRPYRRLRKE